MNIIIEKERNYRLSKNINSCKSEEIKPSNSVNFPYLINLAVSMFTVRLLCQVRAARNYASLCANNLQMFFEVAVKGQFENKSA